MLTVAVLAAVEYFPLVYGRGVRASSAYGVAAVAGLVITAALGFPLLLEAGVAALMGVVIVDIITGVHDAAKTAFGVYGLLSIGLFMAMGTRVFCFDGGAGMTALTIASTIACDSFAYFGGSLYGRHKLCPDISPKKTVEGSVTGFVAAMAVYSLGILFPGFAGGMGFGPWFYVLAGAIVGVMGQFGDLAASMVKRAHNTKDFSSLLPGHGGMMDRIDGLVYAFAAVYVTIALLGGF
jgi:phosphatidate cytidylyltransferase